MGSPTALRRLAVVSPFIDKRHGTERRVAEFVSRLKRDYEIHIYSQRVEDLELDGIVWHRIPDLPGPHLLRYLWWFGCNHLMRWRDRTLHGLNFDVVYSPGINCLDADAVSVHVVFTEFARRVGPELELRRNPVRSWPRLLHRRLYYALISRLERRVYPRRARAIAAVSRQVQAQLQAAFGRIDGVSVVYNGIDRALFSPAVRLARRAAERDALGLSADEFVLLLIGNGWSNKGLPCALEALARLPDLPARLLVVGRDDRAPYEAMIARLGLDGRVRFLEPDADVVRFYAAADVYVGPSQHDSFAQPPAEAMACGLPVITSVNNGGVEIIEDGVNGFVLHDPADSEALAAALHRLHADASLRARVGERAASTAAELNWDRNADAMRALFTSAGDQRVAEAV